MELVYFLIIWSISGWISTQIDRSSGIGIIGNMIASIIGAVLGGYLAENLVIEVCDLPVWKILGSFSGAWLALLLVCLIKRR